MLKVSGTMISPSAPEYPCQARRFVALAVYEGQMQLLNILRLVQSILSLLGGGLAFKAQQYLLPGGGGDLPAESDSNRIKGLGKYPVSIPAEQRSRSPSTALNSSMVVPSFSVCKIAYPATN